MSGVQLPTIPGADPRLAALFQHADSCGWSVAGTTSPNPPVGCVIVGPGALDAREGQHTPEVLATGATQPPGGPHAEVMALQSLGARGIDPRGCHAIVTLEPCNHTGRTGSCAQALAEAGIARVDYLFADPHQHAGGGAESLRAAGVEVHGPYLPNPASPLSGSTSGPEGSATFEWVWPASVEPWIVATTRRRPHVTVKLANTLDGFVAATDRTSQWITSPASRRAVHEDRGRRDAIVVGTETVLVDNPRLTARDASGAAVQRQPLRVIVGRRDVPATAAIFTGPGEALHFPTRDVRAVLDSLQRRGVVDVLVEGGPQLTGAFLDAGLADALVMYQAPSMLRAGLKNIPTAPGLQTTIGDLQQFIPRRIETFGADIRWTLTRPTL